MSDRDDNRCGGKPFDDKSFESARDRREREAFAPVEAMIRAAGGYVRSSEDLRPRTLEAARHSVGKRRWNRGAYSLVAATVLLALCNVPGRFIPAAREETASTATVREEFELRQRAAKGMGFSFNPSWAWYEAFFALRNQQADLIKD
jgi:hypothetical protein